MARTSFGLRSLDTLPLRFSTRYSVAVEAPANLATSLMVHNRMFISVNVPLKTLSCAKQTALFQIRSQSSLAEFINPCRLCSLKLDVTNSGHICPGWISGPNYRLLECNETGSSSGFI